MADVQPDATVRMREVPDTWGDGGGGAEVRWTGADADALGYAVAAAADTGVLLMLSRSQDGGALMVAFMDDGVTKRRWFHDAAEAVTAIDQITAHVAPQPSSPPPNGSRPRRSRPRNGR
jgi:hypothetical protein